MCPAGHLRRCFSSCLATVAEISRRGELRTASPPLSLPLSLPLPLSLLPVFVLVLFLAAVPLLLAVVEARACA